MSAFVVDVNVAIVANGKSPQADNDCFIACIDSLAGIQQSGIVLLDDRMRILGEYMRNLSMSGQPGLGDYFMKWVWENHTGETYCRCFSLTPRSGDPDDYLEFPDDPTLNGFDRSDRKYVAVAVASRLSPEIVNAVDTDWWIHLDALEANGVRVNFLCPQCMRK